MEELEEVEPPLCLCQAHWSLSRMSPHSGQSLIIQAVKRRGSKRKLGILLHLSPPNTNTLPDIFTSLKVVPTSSERVSRQTSILILFL